MQRLTSGTDSSLNIWSWRDGNLLDQVPGHTQQIISVAIAKSGQVVAAGSLDGDITIRKMTNRREFRTLKGHTKPVKGLSFFNDGTHLASVSHDKTVKIWQVGDGAETDSLLGPFAFESVAISPDDSLLAAGDIKGVITLWDLKSRRLLGFLFDDQSSSMDGVIFKVKSGDRMLVYSLPCGSPTPVGATCTCNCVKGSFVEHVVKIVPEIVTREEKSTTAERWEQIRIARARQLEERQARIEEQRQIAIRYYYYLQQQQAASSYSSGRSTSRCICIPVRSSR